LSPLIKKEDIENEARAIDILRNAEVPCANIVQVLRHGWLTSKTRGNASLPVYFVDMELGIQSLEDYIRGGKKHLREVCEPSGCRR